IAGGSQIPIAASRVTESAKTLADLRASWRGVQKLLLAYDGSALSADFLDTVVSFLDPSVTVTLVDVSEEVSRAGGAVSEKVLDVVRRGVERARELGRDVDYRAVLGEPGPMIVKIAQE